MNLKGVKYDAFISYRHSPLDMYISKSIHKRLESFKLPKSVLSKVTNGKTKIERVFRDQVELPLADNLSDPIEMALTNADFLVVICTPRLPQSKWCKKEITTFIEKHGREHVLLVLAEGEPNESFPEEVRYAKKNVTYPDGTSGIEEVEVEPLAADVRGKSKRETEKLLDDAAIKIAAAIFNLNYDDLKQRHKEAKQKKRIRIISAIAGAMAVFAGVCLTMMLKINSQKNIISTQYDEIQEKYESAMVVAAENLVAQGRRKDAIYAVANASAGACRPETEYELSKLLNVYNADSSMLPNINYEIYSSVSEIAVSPSKRLLALRGQSGDIGVFDIETGEKKALFFTHGGESLLTDSSLAFADDNTVFYLYDGDLYKYKIDIGKAEQVCKGPVQIFGTGTDNLLMYFESETLHAADADGADIFSYNLVEMSGADTIYLPEVMDFSRSADNKRMIIVVDIGDGDRMAVIGIELSTGSLETMFLLKKGQMVTAGVDEEYIYLYDYVKSYWDDYATAQIRAYNYYTADFVWGCFLDDLICTGMMLTDSNIFLYGQVNTAVVEKESGYLLMSVPTQTDVIGAFMYDDEISVIDLNGKIWSLYESSEVFGEITQNVFAIKPDFFVTDLALFGDSILVSGSSMNYVTRYSPMPQGSIKAFEESKNEIVYGEATDYDESAYLSGFSVNDGKYRICQSYGKSVTVTDADGKEIAKSFNADAEIIAAGYIPSIDAYVLDGYSYTYLMNSNFEVIGAMEVCRGYYDGYFYTQVGDASVALPYLDAQKIIEMAKQEIEDYEPSDEVKTHYGIK